VVVTKQTLRLGWRLGCYVLLLVALFTRPAWCASPLLLGQVTATAAIIVDYQTGELLFARNPDLELPPASTTKILTAYIALRDNRLGADVRVSKYAASMPPSKIGLKPGWAMNMNDLVYAILLNSANDAAVTIAEGLSGSVEEFAARMNRTAWQMGALHSHFANPSGLPDDDHYSSARDLALIMRHALQVESFERVLSTPLTSILPVSGSRRTISLRSHNRLLEDPRTDVIGKTGWTRVAKKCFVGAATQNGRRVLVAVLGSSNLWGDLRRMIDWTFDNPTDPSLDNPTGDSDWQQAAQSPVGLPRLQRGGSGDTGGRSRSVRERGNQRENRQAFHVRLGTFRSRDEANRLRKRLKASGYAAIVQEIKLRQPRYLITIVGISSRATAQKVAQTLRRTYRLDTQVIAADA
jgi:D-alanyl-D-alanine carboxypeptidase (penicillin-binding protein 5/6)